MIKQRLVEVGLGDIKATDVQGAVCLCKRYGNTEIHQKTVDNDSRYRLTTRSGKINVFLDDPLLDQVGFTLITLCGIIHYNGLWQRVKGRLEGIAGAMTFSTAYAWADKINTQLYLQSDSGDVSIDKIK